MSRARTTGNIISGLGHVLLLGWILFGGWFSSRPDPLEVREVAVISGAEFQAMLEARRQPAEVADAPVAAAPEVTQDAPELDSAPPEPATPPQPIAEPSPELPPELPPEPAQVQDAVPQVSQAAPELPEPPAEVTVEDAPAAPTPVERPAEVVAPTPAPRPEPDATDAPEVQEAVVPEETGETVEEASDAAAPPEATDRIVTEATTPPAAAPTASMRPPARRPDAARPVQTAQTTAPAPQADAVDGAAVQAALEAALSSAASDVPVGPPMSSGERDALRLAVQACWNVDPGARWAQTTVTVAMSMTPDGKVVGGSLQMIASEGGDGATSAAAFGAARRAILLCEKDGYPLPPEKYGQWKDIEMTFNPERMRIR